MLIGELGEGRFEQYFMECFFWMTPHEGAENSDGPLEIRKGCQEAEVKENYLLYWCTDSMKTRSAVRWRWVTERCLIIGLRLSTLSIRHEVVTCIFLETAKANKCERNGRRHQRIKKTKGHAGAERNSSAKFADELRGSTEGRSV